MEEQGPVMNVLVGLLLIILGSSILASKRKLASWAVEHETSIAVKSNSLLRERYRKLYLVGIAMMACALVVLGAGVAVGILV